MVDDGTDNGIVSPEIGGIKVDICIMLVWVGDMISVVY